MIIKTLIENRTTSENFEAEHGLSLYIELSDKKILFDSGESNKFIRNSKKMGVNLEEVDLMFLSHGHYDHGGGIASFMEINSKALIYINKNAVRRYGALEDGDIELVGIDLNILDESRIKLVEENLELEGMILFSDTEGNVMKPRGNDRLLMEKDGEWVKDDFSHEQNLLIREGDKRVLFVGCSHRGIVNILNQCNRYLDKPLTAVFGGFHLYDLDTKDKEDLEFLNNVTDSIKINDTIYYTGHCTGYEQYEEMKKYMGDRIHYISTGTTIEV